MAFLNFTQDLKSEKPRLRVDFGAFGGMIGKNTSRYRKYQFQVNEDHNSCELRAKHTPSLSGNLSFLDKEVAFKVFSLNFDTETQAISKLDLRAFTFPIDCISSESINSQFQSETNQILQKYKDQASGESLGKSLFIKMFSNGN